MATKYVWTDLHEFAPNKKETNFDFTKKYGDNHIFLGDIFDLANCKKDEVPQCYRIAKTFIDNHPRRFVLGNHERMGAPVTMQFVVIDDTVFTHGDLEANPDKWKDYRLKPHGASKFKRTFVVPFIEEAEKIIDRKPKEDFLKRAAKLAKDVGATRYVCGHFHPEKQIDVVFDGIQITILPKGVTQIVTKPY